MLLAVYGTLKRGFRNHRLMDPKAFEFLGSFVTADRFTMVGRGASFPELYKDGLHQVSVELYRLREGCEEYLSHIDRLEGHPNYYRRQPVRIVGMPEAQMYVTNGEPPPWLPITTIRVTNGVVEWVKTHD